MSDRTVAILGVGLIGGSLGLALAEAAPGTRVIGWGRKQSKLERALELGAITEYTLDLEKAVREADTVVLCTPVDVLPRQAVEVLACVAEGTVVTDCGSIKRAIVNQVERDVPAVKAAMFVGGHPLAGSELTGVEHARPDLYRGRRCILTPGRFTAPEAVERVYDLWQQVGADVILMRPEVHDRLLATTSHLPHVVAAALVNAVPPDALPFVASGFLDSTRIAGGAAEIWVPILLQNRDKVLQALREFGTALEAFTRAIQACDEEAIRDLWNRAAARRRALATRDAEET